MNQLLGVDTNSNEDNNQGLFAIRGSLDGETTQEFIEREQFIGLMIGEEEFYLSIATVNEIVMLLPITYVPRSEEFVEGVINLRGTILPAINLRKMIGLPRGEVTPSTRIVIANHESKSVGLIVDAITYVVALLPTEIEDQSLPGKNIGADIIHRISKHDEKITGILDLSKILVNAGDTKKSADIE